MQHESPRLGAFSWQTRDGVPTPPKARAGTGLVHRRSTRKLGASFEGFALPVATRASPPPAEMEDTQQQQQQQQQQDVDEDEPTPEWA